MEPKVRILVAYEHLSFVRVPRAEGHDHNAALAVPVPYDEDVLDMFSDRIVSVMQLVPLAFLIENNVYFVDVPEQKMTEPQFLNKLPTRTRVCTHDVTPRTP